MNPAGSVEPASPDMSVPAGLVPNPRGDQPQCNVAGKTVEGFALLQDFAIIMVVAGVVMLLFRKLNQPPILGYLAAGVVIGPYTVTGVSITDIDTVRLLADLGLVLLLFGTGLDFSWGKIRKVGLAAVIIAVAESITMFSIGYGLGHLFGWSTLDSLFLGAAMQVTGTAWIVKLLRDMGKTNLVSSKLLVAISVVEDFGAVAVITVLSGVAATGVADLGSIGSLGFRLIVFVLATLVLGALIVPRIIRFTRQFHSREALLITSLALCFGMAILGRYLELSVAAGAFLMGALIGDTEHSGEISDVVAPVRDMFAALFFVAIGMLIDIRLFGSFIIPALAVCAVFMFGKVIVNTVATFFTGYDGKTALRVGTGMPQMGEFSLAAAKMGVDRGVVVAPIYPVVAITTAITSFFTPYVMRSADFLADLFSRKSPEVLRMYVSRMSEWLQALRGTLGRDSKVSHRARRSLKAIIINLLIVMVILGVGAVVIQFVEDLTRLSNIRTDILAVIISALVLVSCAPALFVIWRNVQRLAEEATSYLITRRSSAREWRRERLRIVIRDSIMVVVTLLMALWTIPIVVQLTAIGSYALAVPLVLVAVVLFLVLGSMRQIHGEVERTFGRVLLGEEHGTAPSRAMLGDIEQGATGRAIRAVKLAMKKLGVFLRVTRPGTEAAEEAAGENDREVAVDGETDESEEGTGASSKEAGESRGRRGKR